MIRRGAPHDAQSFDDAWTSGDSSSVTGEIAGLVGTADLLCRSAVAEPDEHFRSELRDRLMVQAAEVLVAHPAPAVVEPVRRPAPAVPAHPVRRRLVGLTVAAVAGLGSIGMISSSATAVPGDVLYPVKRGVESVQLALHRNDTSRGQFQLDQARERLAEARWLDSHGEDGRVAAALDNFSDQADDGSARLFMVYNDQITTSNSSSSDAPIDAVNDFAAAATITLNKMSDDLPADAQAALEGAADTVTGLASQASSLCSSCAPADVSSLLVAVSEALVSTPDAPDAPTATSGSHPERSAATTPKPATPDRSGPPKSTPPRISPPALPTPKKPPALKKPPAIKKPPALKDTTDPLVGGLVGGDGGLVPGLGKK